MKNALGAWLHCRHAELHAGTDADYYASAELSHELSEQEIRTVLARISDCDVLFTTGQNYVSWAVRRIRIGTRPANLALAGLP